MEQQQQNIPINQIITQENLYTIQQEDSDYGLEGHFMACKEEIKHELISRQAKMLKTLRSQLDQKFRKELLWESLQMSTNYETNEQIMTNITNIKKFKNQDQKLYKEIDQNFTFTIPKFNKDSCLWKFIPLNKNNNNENSMLDNNKFKICWIIDDQMYYLSLDNKSNSYRDQISQYVFVSKVDLGCVWELVPNVFFKNVYTVSIVEGGIRYYLQVHDYNRSLRSYKYKVNGNDFDDLSQILRANQFTLEDDCKNNNQIYISASHNRLENQSWKIQIHEQNNNNYNK